VNSPEDGPVGPKHVEIRRYLNKTETVTSVGFSFLIGIEILQGRWQHGEKVGYCYPSGLEKTLCKWDVYVTLVTKWLKSCL